MSKHWVLTIRIRIKPTFPQAVKYRLNCKNMYTKKRIFDPVTEYQYNSHPNVNPCFNDNLQVISGW